MCNEEIRRLLALMKGKFPNAPGFAEKAGMSKKDLADLKRTRVQMVKTFTEVLADLNFYDVEQALARWCSRCRFVPSAEELRKETLLFLDEITLRERGFATLGMVYTGVGSQAYREEQERKDHHEHDEI